MPSNATPQEPDQESSTQPKPLKWYEAAIGITITLGIIAVVVFGIIVGVMYLLDDTPPDPVAELTSKVEKELRDNKDETVRVTERADGTFYVAAEFTTRLRKAGHIELEMIDAYKAIYTSGYPVALAEIAARGTLVNQYGQEFDDVIYRSSMTDTTAARVNWEKLFLVEPSLVFDDSWQHLAVR